MIVIRTIRTNAIRQLEGVGSETAALDVDLLLEAALGHTKLDMILEPALEVSPEQLSVFEDLLARRKAREPISQILGKRDFWSLTFTVSRHCLTPRPDSETLIEAALKSVPDKNTSLKILDLGTGSGCLLLSLMSELPNSSGVGIDMSDKALAVAEDNARRLGFLERCDFILSDWAEQLPPAAKFDIILCNPPYIAETERSTLASDVRDYEPSIALFAKDDGYKEYDRLAGIIPALAAKKAQVFLEIGHTQGARVREIFRQTGAKNVRIIQDLAGRDRCVAFNF